MAESEFKFPHDNDDVEVDLEAGKVIERPKADEADEKPEIEVVDDTPAEDRGRKPADPPEEVSDEELSSYDEKVQKRIKKFTRGYHDERRAKEQAQREREAAEELARQALEENRRLKAQLTEGSKEYISQAQKLAEADLSNAQRKYQEAFEANDAEALAKTQAEIAQAAMRLDRAKEMKPLQLPEKEVQTQQASQVDPKTSAWKEKNQWFGPNRSMTAYALGLHQDLVGQGYVAGSDAYFSEIDRTMRKRFPEAFGSQEPESRETTQPRASKPATVVAPAARSTPPTRIRLTASEVAVAKRLGVPLEMYAKQKAAQQKEAQNG